MSLSLLLPLRGRAVQARAVLPRLVETLATQPSDCELIVVESTDEPTHEGLCRDLGIRYAFDCASGTFHKARLLNVALAMAQGEVVAPYDIDLLPSRHTAQLHLELAMAHPQLLITAFRLMSEHELPTDDLEEMRREGKLGPENGPSAVRKWLVQGERFGVVPHFRRDILLGLGGWDENYVGWGAEDQDMIERYLATGIHFMASPDLVYLHLHHPPDPAWSEDRHRAANMAHYYDVRKFHG
jgi:hypothetical protein